MACNGALFNNIYQPPFTRIDETASASLSLLINQMKAEMKNTGLAQYEILVSYLKIFLITASRIKTEQQPQALALMADIKEPFVLQNLKDAIEKTLNESTLRANMPRPSIFPQRR